MVVEETQKEKTGEQAAQQGTVLVCGKHHHTRGEDKTRHGNGWTHKGEERRGTHKGKGKGEDKAWLYQRHSPHRKREKGKKTMSIIRQSRALHRVHLFQPIIETYHACNDKKREG